MNTSGNATYPIMNALEPRHAIPMDKTIAVGFGAAFVTCDGETVWEESIHTDWDSLWKVQDAENAAAQNPNRDWRIHLIGPLAEGHWQRQPNGEWVMYEKGQGFA